MANTVFILGAGASKKAGAPLMAEFLDSARDLWRTHYVDTSAFAHVFKGISRLQQVHSKASLDIHNVESVFAAFEMSKTLNRFAEYSTNEIHTLVESMREVIIHTLDASIRIPTRQRKLIAPPPYPEFATLLSDLRERAEPRRTAAVITFNYDTCLDFALYQNGTGIDYSLEETKREDRLPLLKLHGSLNWARCDKCMAIVPWHFDKYFAKYHWPDIDSETRFMTMRMGEHIKTFEHCGQQVASAPIVVPPTWNKTEYHRALSQVWGEAAKELSDTEDLFIIGYSLPDSDAFFRYLFALGTIGETPLRRVWVFNPDNRPEVENRFRALFGPGAEQRFQYIPVTFEDAIIRLREEFQHSFRR